MTGCGMKLEIGTLTGDDIAELGKAMHEVTGHWPLPLAYAAILIVAASIALTNEISQTSAEEMFAKAFGLARMAHGHAKPGVLQ